jgi:hypothetical protein
MAWGVDLVQLERELRLKLENDARRGQIKREGEAFAHEVRARWVAIWESLGPHPWETGGYVESIEVHGTGRPIGFARQPAGAVSESGEKIGGRFTKNIYGAYRVGTTNEHAGFIEYGTGPDAPGGHATWIDLEGNQHWGPNTPTPEFAPAATTAAFFHGTGPD